MSTDAVQSLFLVVWLIVRTGGTGVDSSKVKSMARQAAQPGKTVQQATDEALFGGIDAGKHTKASAAKAPDILYRPDQHRSSSEVVTGGERTSSSGGLSQGQRRGGCEVEGSRPLITEMVAPEARLPEYEMTASHTSTSAACGDGDGRAHESFTMVVTAPELLHKSNRAAVDLVPGGVLVSIEGCKDLFVPLKGIHGNVAGSRGDDRSSSTLEDSWQARAKRSSKRGKLTISIERLPPAAV